MKSLAPNLAHKEKSNSPRRHEERGSSFHEVLSSVSSSKGTGSSGISADHSNTSSILDDSASSSDAGVSSDFSNGHCNRHHHGSSSNIADEDEEDGDGIISLGKMKWFFELNEKQTTETPKSARDIPIVIDDVSSDDDRDLREIITDRTKKPESVDFSSVGIDSSFTFSLNDSQKQVSAKEGQSLLGKRK